MKSNKMKVVIIGGVATGPKTAARLRRLNPEAEITIIERGKVLSYAGCGIPYTSGGYKGIPTIKLFPLQAAGYLVTALFLVSQQAAGNWTLRD
jgi:NADPH-dependent 2,4-dienoyl-CoA reductase/sulfur reductase-like enzyme